MATAVRGSGKFFEMGLGQLMPYMVGFFGLSYVCGVANTSLLGNGLPHSFAPEWVAESKAIGYIGVSLLSTAATGHGAQGRRGGTGGNAEGWPLLPLPGRSSSLWQPVVSLKAAASGSRDEVPPRARADPLAMLPSSPAATLLRAPRVPEPHQVRSLLPSSRCKQAAPRRAARQQRGACTRRASRAQPWCSQSCSQQLLANPLARRRQGIPGSIRGPEDLAED
jgi:hypothetical protein